MDDDQWLTNAEDLLLGGLEESPLPLWKFAVVMFIDDHPAAASIPSDTPGPASYDRCRG